MGVRNGGAARAQLQAGVPVATRSSNPAYLAEDIDVYGWSLNPGERAALAAAKEPTGGGRDGGPCLFCHD